MMLSDAGMPADTIFDRLDELKAGDVRWREGRAFTLAYYAGADVLAVAEEAYRRYATENALNTNPTWSASSVIGSTVETRRPAS
jgi:sphinganine-1-phosphate aldolase